eukprot:501422-Rhodomonas_salina.2
MDQQVPRRLLSPRLSARGTIRRNAAETSSNCHAGCLLGDGCCCWQAGPCSRPCTSRNSKTGTRGVARNQAHT